MLALSICWFWVLVLGDGANDVGSDTNQQSSYLPFSRAPSDRLMFKMDTEARFYLSIDGLSRAKTGGQR